MSSAFASLASIATVGLSAPADLVNRAPMEPGSAGGSF